MICRRTLFQQRALFHSTKMSAQGSQQFPFGLSDKVKENVNKMDVWSVFSPLAGHVPKDSLNLGQGFMNWPPPEFVRKAAHDAIDKTDTNHYSLPRGRQRLRDALSEYLSPSFGRQLDPAKEIIVTAGANEGMYAFLVAFIRDGDEVILFEPFFDQYVPNVQFNGGKPVYVPLQPPEPRSDGKPSSSSDWKIDFDMVRKAITPKTRAIIFNTPHNPIGKVFTEQELQQLGDIAEENDLMILSDEVYDCLTYGQTHKRIASLSPKLWNRTVTVGSAGKSFSCTGWRVGWLVGPDHLIQPALTATTRIVFVTNSPLQEATAAGLEQAKEQKFFENQISEYTERREVLCQALDRLGLPYTKPDGSYFILVDVSKLKIPDDFASPDLIKGRAKDWRACWFIAQKAGVVAIPPTDFYSESHWNIGERFIRLAFCKDLDTLKAAGERLQKLKPYLEN